MFTTLKNSSIWISTIVALTFGACGTDSGHAVPSGTPSGTPPGSDPQIEVQSSAVSECGGFAAATNADSGKFDAALSYCDAEVLNWKFDPNTGVLRFSNERVTLNCCGDHSIKVSEQNGVLVITERDAPEAKTGGARCNCMCVFDFVVEVAKVKSGTKQIKLVRHVTDEGGPKDILTTQIDLSKASGTIVIDKSPSYFCHENTTPEPEVSYLKSFDVSDCGAFLPKHGWLAVVSSVPHGGGGAA